MKTSQIVKSYAQKSVAIQAYVNKFRADQALFLTISSLFGAVLLGLVLSIMPMTSIYAEQVNSASQSDIAAITVDINTASAEEMAEALTGIGTKKAEAIVEYRNQHGAFTDKNQLLNIKGIGEVILSKNSNVILLK